MNHGRIAWIALAAALVVFSARRGTRAQLAVEPPSGGGTILVAPPTTSAPAATQTRPAPPESLPSAASVLEQMLNSSPGSIPGMTDATLIVPAGPEPGANGLLREGQEIALRAGRLKKDDTGHVVFVFDPKESPAYPPMGVIPSRRLAAMEDAAGFAPGRTPNDMTFRITTEVTEYRSKNYLYIKPSAIPVPSAPAATASAASGSTDTPSGPSAGTVTPVGPAAALKTEGSVISNRVGRLVRDPRTGAKLIAFESDGRRMADPPMGVVPCKYLALMEDATEDGNKPIKFKVSGEITTYRGKNYLYLKYVGVVPDLGQGIGAGSNLDP